MTDKEFEAFFFKTFENDVPADARREIKWYWRENKVAPTLILNDRRIASEFGKVEIAAVTGLFSMNCFLFREFLYNNAPEDILRSIILHEIAHCYEDRGKPEERRKQFCMLKIPDFKPRFGGPVADALDKIRKMDKKRHEMFQVALCEGKTSKISATWGSDEEKAIAWVNSYLESQKQNQQPEA